MKHKKITSAVMALAVTVSASALTLPVSPTAYAAGATVVRLDPSKASPFNDGKFEGWGTSMGWWGNRIGYSEDLAQQAAEDLYSEEGLGLDIIRYNVGGGDNPTHDHITRSDSKLPCFAVPEYEGGEYEANGKNTDVTNFKKDTNGDVEYTWNWDADYNQMNVLKKVKAVTDKEGSALHIEGYTNSPPWFMTKSQCSSGGDDTAENLDPSNYDVFADFLAKVAKHMKEDEGLPFDSYSPMNEPEPKSNYWRALSAKQEGNLVAPGANQSGLLKATKDAFVNAGLSDILVAGLDETDLGYTISSFNALTADGKASLDRLDTHTYGGSNRAGVKQIAISSGKNLWMSEVDGSWDGFGLADRIITDLNGMQASAWVMWDIIDSHRDKDFASEAGNSLNVTGKMWGVGMANHDTQKVEWANKYYAYGQFTKYINPGDTLIASSGTTLAAYNRKTGDIKIVVNNGGSSDVKYDLDLSAFRTVGSTVKEIRSNNKTGNAAEHWKEIEGEATLENKILSTTAKAGTVTTYIVSGPEKFVDEYAIITGGGNEISIGTSAVLTLNTNIEGNVTWKISDDTLADITAAEGGKTATVTAKASGAVTVSATVDGYTISKLFAIPSYKLSGTPSWGNASNAPSDADDYRKAADGDLSTAFDGTQNGWVMYDYGSRYKISEIKLAARSGSDYYTRTKGAKIQGSNDAITWTDLYTLKDSIPADEYTTISASQLGSVISYRYYRYINTTTMTNIAEFLISGEYSTGDEKFEQVIDTYSADENGLSYSYALPEEYEDNTAYFAVYDKDNRLSYVSMDKSSDEVEGDFSDSTHKLFVWDEMKPVATFTHTEVPDVNAEPVVTDIDAFTDNFEGAENIFGGVPGGLEDGKIVYASGLERFGNVFIPANTTAEATLDEAIELQNNQLFRINFNMFAGWESSGKDNTFALKDADGNEIVAIYLTGGGYTLQEIRIGGKNVLSGTKVAQSRSNPGTSGNKLGANGWDSAGQEYRNNMGYNKTAEILIEGTGKVSVSFTGGMEDTEASGALTSPISIKSLEVTGACNSSRARIAAYDNFDADLITYGGDFTEPTPAPTASPTPIPTDAPVLPEDGTLISLDFENGLTSGSAYGKASGTPTIVDDTERSGKVVKFNNSASEVITLTDANGNGLLAGQDEVTISFSVKPTVVPPTSWWFFSARDNNAQTYQQEHYLGALLNKDDGKFNVERYNGGGSRAAANSGNITLNTWNDVVISVSEEKTDLYINGELVSSVNSSFKLSDILGSSPVAYLGRANWGAGEYATGYLDDFVIKKGAIVSALDKINLGDLSAVTENLTLPTDGGITWKSSNEDIISTTGVVTRPDETTTVILTATVTENGNTSSKTFVVTVLGLTAAADTFTAYADGNSIIYTSNYGENETYELSVTITGIDESNSTYVKHIDNQGSGKFEGLEKGKYIIAYTIKSDPEKTVTKTVEIKDELDTGAYLMVHFIGKEANPTDEQVYFTVSTDARTWTTLNDKKPVLQSTENQKGIRDPYIIRARDGKYYIIATDLSIKNGGLNWTSCQREGSKNIVIWKSDDLVNWTGPTYKEVGVSNAGCVWAPEAIYDVEKDQYMVFWASKISDDDYAKQRIYSCYTSDFESFTPAEEYIEEDHSVIDTTIVEDKGVFYRFNKWEGQNFVYMEKALSLNGNWEEVTAYNHKETGFEGPTIFKKNKSDTWCLMLDNYNAGGYKPFETADLSSGVFTSPGAVTFDNLTYRHGTVLPITTEEYNALMEEYGKNIPVSTPKPTLDPDATEITAEMTNAGNSGINSGNGILIATGDESKENTGSTQYRAPFVLNETSDYNTVLGSARIGAMEFSVNPDIDPEKIDSAVLNIHVNSVNGNLKEKNGTVHWTLLAAYETNNPTLEYKTHEEDATLAMDQNQYLAVDNDYSREKTFWTNEQCSENNLGWKTMDVTRAVKNALEKHTGDGDVKVVLRLQVPSGGLNVSTTGDNAPTITITTK
ncbi:MAG: discoidin domain-containing protein [Oscillospiraceae bacterium]|nr:discoidin domain-containing protein [Oscillospiraceae bacterium]